MTFEPRNDRIRVTSYSPYLDEVLTDSDNQFDLPFDMTGGTPPDGNVLVVSGYNFCIGAAGIGSCELAAVDNSSLKAVYLGDIGHKGSLSPAMSISSLQRSE
jgi:hypothetical protein